ETRDRLKAQKLKSFAKLSGGKGIHVVVPVTGADWDMTNRVTARIDAAMTADSPQRYLAKMTKSLRRGKIFIDYFRNSREATSVAAYSTRARAGAPISMPLSWETLARTTAGNQFTVLNWKKHLKADPWAEIGKIPQKLPRSRAARAVTKRQRLARWRRTRGSCQPLAISRRRIGLSTRGAMIAATMFKTAAMMNTAVQLPVALINTLPSGTRSDAVPLAVYNRP